MYEDFSQDAVGDFPDKWNTNISGEIVKIDGEEGKWFAITGEGVAMPEFITSIPENSTLEFDLMVNPGFSFYSSSFIISLAQLDNKADFTRYKQTGGDNYEKISVHPKDASSQDVGRSSFSNKKGPNSDLVNTKSAIKAF